MMVLNLGSFLQPSQGQSRVLYKLIRLQPVPSHISPPIHRPRIPHKTLPLRGFQTDILGISFLEPFADLFLIYQRLGRTNDKANKKIEMIRDSEPNRKYRFFFIWIEERVDGF